MKNVVSCVGFGLAGLLTILFAVLKEIGIIGWSWFWVLSPLWIFYGGAILAYMIVMLIAALAE